MNISWLSLLVKFGSKLISGIQLWKAPPFVTFGATSYRVKGAEQRELLNIVRAGDLVLRRYDHYLTSLLIPGYFSHVGIAPNQREMIHATKEGLIKEDILDFLRTDSVVVLRHPDSAARSQAVSKARRLLQDDLPYDYDFDTKDKSAVYCTEVAIHCYPDALIGLENMRRVRPDALLQSEAFELIFDSRVWRQENE